MKTWKASLTVPESCVHPVSDLLEAALDPEARAVALSRLPGTSRTPYWSVEAYYTHPPANGVLEQLLTPFAGSLDLTSLAIEPLPQKDWVRESLQGLAPVRAGRFFVHGSHDADTIPAGTLPLRIDAGLAFGTGHHPSTLGCLLTLQEIIRRKPATRMLDLGCGTGVLAIAMAILGKRRVIASDQDPVAVRVTQENARINGVAPFIQAVHATGLEAHALHNPFDLIVANILARPLTHLAHAISNRLACSGTLILSGILTEQEPMLTSAYRAQGLYLRSRRVLGEWVTLHLE